MGDWHAFKSQMQQKSHYQLKKNRKSTQKSTKPFLDRLAKSGLIKVAGKLPLKRNLFSLKDNVFSPGDFFVHLCGNDSFAKSRKIEFSSKFLEFLRKFWPDDVIVTI